MTALPCLLALLACFLAPRQALAHDLRYQVAEEAHAISVRLFFGDGTDFSFESYEVYRGGEKIPFQVGRTDALGRLVFLPDRPGTWRVKAFSEGGHGVDFSLTTSEAASVEGIPKPLVERYPRAVAGAALILGLFGLIDLFFFVRRRRR